MSGSSGSSGTSQSGLCCPNGGVRATWENYGMGVAGCDGVPSLTMQADPLLNSNPMIDLGNSGQTTLPCALIWGVAPDDIFIPFLGASFLVQSPFVSVDSFNVPPGGFTFVCNIPNDCDQIGQEFYLQTICIDPCGPEGFASSRGLMLRIGDL